MMPSVLRVVAFVIGVVIVSGGAHVLFVRWLCTFFPRLREHRRKLWTIGGLLVLLPMVVRWAARALGSSSLVSLQALVMGEQMIVVLGALPLLLFLGLTGVVGAVLDRRVKRGEAAPARSDEEDPSEAAAEPVEPPPSKPAPAKPPSPHLSRRDAVMRVGGVAAWGMTGSLLGWGMVRGRHAFAVEEVVVRVARLPKALDGYTIAQVSDIHCGPFVGERELGEAFELVRSIKADLVVATGDLVDFDAAFTPLFARRFADLPARDGRLAILGNHDYYAGARVVRDHLAAAGVEVLVNESRVVRPNDGGGIALVGVDDMWSKPDLDGALANVGKDLPKVLLAHQPRFFDFAAGAVDLQLSGHTHGGQICPGFNPAGLVMRYVAGRYEKSGTVLWVNRGVGVAAIPSRVAAPPEVTKLVLVAG